MKWIKASERLPDTTQGQSYKLFIREVEKPEHKKVSFLSKRSGKSLLMQSPDKWEWLEETESPAPADGWVSEVCEYIQRVIGGERPDVTYLQDILKRNPAITPTP